MLDYLQPILKKDLYECVGTISNDKKYELFDLVKVKLGISDEKQETNETKTGTETE